MTRKIKLFASKVWDQKSLWALSLPLTMGILRRSTFKFTPIHMKWRTWPKTEISSIVSLTTGHHAPIWAYCCPAVPEVLSGSCLYVDLAVKYELVEGHSALQWPVFPQAKQMSFLAFPKLLSCGWGRKLVKLSKENRGSRYKTRRR